MIWFISYLFVFSTVLFGIASLAKQEYVSKKNPGKKEAKFFVFLKEERLAYLILFLLSLVFSAILFYSFPENKV